MLENETHFSVTYAIGDIHGRNDLLSSLLDRIVDHRRTIDGPAKIVFLGDYIDRGPDVKGVLQTLLHSDYKALFDSWILLKGNHELDLQEVLSAELVGLPPDASSRDCLRWNSDYETREAEYGMPIPELLAFLQNLPLYHADGVRLFTHAGVGRGLPVEQYGDEELLWYMGKVEDSQGRLVVHGHISGNRPVVTEHEVNIDTSAWMSGRLTCAIFLGDSRKPTFIETNGEPALEWR